MTLFNPRIPRPLAADLGREAIAITEAGEYTAPSRTRVDLHSAIASAVARTVEYPPDATLPATAAAPGPHATRIEVTRESTLTASRRLLAEGHTAAALNFASAHSPGGGFLTGARAQEELLARSSALFACLVGRRMYAFHAEQGDDLYSDRAIWSPDVPVFRGDDHRLLESPYPCTIVTCAAPYSAALGAVHGRDAMVLGAWECGAFGGDPALVARLFREALEGPFQGAFWRVVFATADTTADQGRRGRMAGRGDVRPVQPVSGERGAPAGDGRVHAGPGSRAGGGQLVRAAGQPAVGPTQAAALRSQLLPGVWRVRCGGEFSRHAVRRYREGKHATLSVVRATRPAPARQSPCGGNSPRSRSRNR